MDWHVSWPITLTLTSRICSSNPSVVASWWSGIAKSLFGTGMIASCGIDLFNLIWPMSKSNALIRFRSCCCTMRMLGFDIRLRFLWNSYLIYTLFLHPILLNNVFITYYLLISTFVLDYKNQVNKNYIYWSLRLIYSNVK